MKTNIITLFLILQSFFSVVLSQNIKDGFNIHLLIYKNLVIIYNYCEVVKRDTKKKTRRGIFRKK